VKLPSQKPANLEFWTKLLSPKVFGLTKVSVYVDTSKIHMQGFCQVITVCSSNQQRLLPFAVRYSPI